MAAVKVIFLLSYVNVIMELRFRTPFTMICAGATQSGKTTHVRKMLKSMPHLFTNVPDYVIYFYNLWQPIFSTMCNETFQPMCHEHAEAPPSSFDTAPLPQQWGAGATAQCFHENMPQERPIVNEWINMLPTTELLKAKTTPYMEGNGTLIIIDDFVQQLDDDISELFTVLSHANNISVILLTQNLFSKNKVYRTISLNSMYITLFKNPRDRSQITSFASQISPRNIRWVVDAFAECTKAPYSYMMYDSHQATREDIRLRSNFLPGDGAPRTWFRKDLSQRELQSIYYS